MDTVVRGVDIGYGNIKIVTAHKNFFDVPEVDKFPSRAVISNTNDISGGMLSRRKTVQVEVNGKIYEVGPDVTLAQGTHDQAGSTDKGFCMTDVYMARVLGALYYIRAALPNDGDVIDLLVGGLPVSTYPEYRNDLQKKLTGTFTLPFGKTVTVKQCSIIPQPMGAYFDSIYGHGGDTDALYNQFKTERHLIIDPGFFTFDWMVTDGMKPIEKRSGSVYRGMYSVIESMAEVIAKEEKTDQHSTIKILDDAIRENKTPKLFGSPINMDKYMPRAQGVIAEAINSLASSVGDGADIDNIILAGGGSDYYFKAISEQFPRHTVKVCEDPVFSNVKGFQFAGVSRLLQQNRNARRDTLAAKE